MSRVNLEDLVDCYVEAILEAIQNNYTRLDVFYKHIFARVSEKTGFSEEEIKSIHHPFHWNLFLKKTSVLELITSKENGNNYNVYVNPENLPLNKSKLSSSVLGEYRELLQEKLDKIQK